MYFNIIGVYAYGFEKPSAIQQRAVQPIILGRDLIAQAQSGEMQIWKNVMLYKTYTHA